MTYLLFLSLLLSAIPCGGAEEGKIAPDLKAKLFSGEEFSLSKQMGQLVIYHFWATWCEPCKIEMPVLELYFKKHRREGLRLIAISMDRPKDEKKVREISKKYTFDFAMARDSDYKGYGRIWRLPLTFVIDRKGILVTDGWVTDKTLEAADLEKVVTPLLEAQK